MHTGGNQHPFGALFLPFVALALSASAAHAGTVEVQPNLDTSMCLDVTDNKLEDGALVQLWRCAASDNQLWTRDGALLRVAGHLCLDVQDGDDANGTPVQVWSCDAQNPHQQWSREGRLLRWANTNKCLHIWRGLAGNGAKLQIRDCDKTSMRQAFRLLAQNSPLSTPSASGNAGGSQAGPAPATSSQGLGTGSFLGFSYIALDAFLDKHPMLKGIRQDIIDAGNSGSPALPPILLAAIAMQESSGNPKVQGGLMQFTYPPTWATYGKGDINNARDSLFAATRYLNALLRENNNDLSKSLRAYNGDGNPRYFSEIQSWLTGGFPYGPGT